ncbi:MAG TPA: hypothetical protein VEL68_23800, partial [Thermodesulfobacteriota bacterium]|nr:hypothetical protein [Thermodesulfobacteriota bacterium]
HNPFVVSLSNHERITTQSLEGEGGREGEMKKRIVILMEEEVVKQAQERASQEGRTLGDLIQDALVSYWGNKEQVQRTREGAYQLFCERPIRVSRKQFNELLKEESFKPL